MSEILEIPNAWKEGVITKQGLGLLSKLVNGHTLNITRAETGAGWVDPALLEEQTAVTEPKQALDFDPVSYPEEGKCEIPCRLTNAEVTESYIARQIGLYAMDPDEGEILFYITQVEDDDGGTGIPSINLIPSYSSTWNLVIYYGMADGVDVTVDPAGTVTWGEMNAAIDKKVEETVGPMVDSAMADYANNVGSALIREITIPKDGWTEASEVEDGYKYTVDVAVADVLDTHFPILAFDIPSLSIAGEAELCPTIETLEGAIRFWTKEIPTADLTGTVLLRSENLVDLDTATDEEVKDEVEDIFGEGSSGGLPSGYEVASPEDVDNMLTDVFGSGT